MPGFANGFYQTTQTSKALGNDIQIDDESIAEVFCLVVDKGVAQTGCGYPGSDHGQLSLPSFEWVWHQPHIDQEVNCYNCGIVVGGAVGQIHYEREERDGLGGDRRVWSGVVVGMEDEADFESCGTDVVAAVGQ